MAGSELLINCSPFETRVALLENDQVAEIFIERDTRKGIVGNIYKGKIIKIVPGLQAVFVDIGGEKAAFLYVNDVVAASLDPEDTEEIENVDEGSIEEYVDDFHSSEEESGESQIEGQGGEILVGKTGLKKRVAPIQDVLEEGKEIIVQVAKDMIGTKGARLTTYISLPGRYLVYMPNVDHVGVSKRIQDEEDRERLKTFVEGIRGDKGGFIVRTASAGVDTKKLKNESEFLLKLWRDITRKTQKISAPTLLHSEVGITLRAARDLFTKDVDRLIVDDVKEYQKLVRFINAYLPRFRKNVHLYDDSEPIFNKYGLNLEIARALGSKVWLKSGGYIIIEQTEALTSIDVNTGRYIGQENLEETSLLTNLEAAKEIAIQVRLRNVGGIIIVDFIDMEKEDNRERVFEALQESFSSDRAKTNILKMSELGLIQMTRKRIRESIGRTLTEPCPSCDALGRVKSLKTIVYSILHDAYSIAREEKLHSITIITSREVMKQFYNQEAIYLEIFEKEFGVRIKIESKEEVSRDYYEFMLE